MTVRDRSVLLLGSSLHTFSHSSEAESIPALVEQRLNDSMPGYSWTCRGRQLYMTSQVVSRLHAYLAEGQPDVIVFDLPTYQFLHRAASIRVRRRWPRLYAPFNSVMEALKGLGEEAWKAPAARGAHCSASRGTWLEC